MPNPHVLSPSVQALFGLALVAVDTGIEVREVDEDETAPLSLLVPKAPTEVGGSDYGSRHRKDVS